MKPLPSWVTRTRIEGLAILLIAAGYLWESGNVPMLYQMSGVPGPTTFPRVLGLVFGLCGLWLLISPMDIRARRNAARGEEAPPAAAETTATAPAEDSAHRRGNRRHFVVLWVVVLLYLWLMPILGFPLATLLLLLAFLPLLGERRWPVVLSFSLISTALIFVGFKLGLNVRLPLGLIEPWFK